MFEQKFILLTTAALLTITSVFAKHEIKIEPRIVNGIDAVRSQFPYYVYLEVKSLREENVCGGSLISRDVVLTAGHCIEDAASVQVHLGSLSARNWMEIERTVIKVWPSDLHIHPEYSQRYTFK